MNKDFETQVYAADDPTGDAVVGEKDGTVHDVKDMQRMGKEQQFRVGFHYINMQGPLEANTDISFNSETLDSSQSWGLL